LDAAVISVEKAMGAFAAQAFTAADLRIVEARGHAQSAARSSASLIPAAHDLPKVEAGGRRDAARAYADQNPNATLSAMLPPAAYDAYGRSNLDDSILHKPLVLYRRRRSSTTLRTLSEACVATHRFAEGLAADSPTGVANFVRQE
jgi:hypothetical protein